MSGFPRTPLLQSGDGDAQSKVSCPLSNLDQDAKTHTKELKLQYMMLGEVEFAYCEDAHNIFFDLKLLQTHGRCGTLANSTGIDIHGFKENYLEIL